METDFLEREYLELAPPPEPRPLPVAPAVRSLWQSALRFLPALAGVLALVAVKRR